jgi:AraC-like DNA-binding protein
MEHSAVYYINMILIVTCAAMSMVFLAVQLPSNKGISKYRTSLRFLASAYLVMSSIELMVLIFDLPVVNLISMESLIIASLQAALFTSTLIVLINPKMVTKSYIGKQLLPMAFFLIMYLLVATRWGNPVISNLDELKLLAWHPAVMVRELFLAYYALQLICLTNVFCREARKYEAEIANFFSDAVLLHTPGVRYCFYSALIVGITALISCFVFTEILTLIFTIVFALFYTIFGIYYIQYPRLFKDIEQAICPVIDFALESAGRNSQLEWSQLKEEVMNERYYLIYGITIEQLAQRLSIGRTTLANFINNEEGLNFNAWVNSLRAESVKGLLIKYPDYSLSQIAEAVGHNDFSDFDLHYKLAT